METTIQVQEAKLSNNKEWFNITTTDNKKISISVSNVKLKDDIETIQGVPFPLTGNLVTKDDGKMFLWDIKPKSEKKPYGGKSFDPISSLWLNSMNNATGLLTAYATAGAKVTAQDVIKMAKEFFTEGLEHIKK